MLIRFFVLLTSMMILSSCMSLDDKFSEPVIGNSSNDTSEMNDVSETESVSVINEPVLTSKPDMSELNEIDTLIIETKCDGFKVFGVHSYWGCLKEQIEESKTVSLPDFTDVDNETREIIFSYCEGFVLFGIRSFYECLDDQLKSIGR